MSQELQNDDHNPVDEEETLNIIENDLRNVFTEQKKLDEGSVVSSQIVVDPPKVKIKSNAENTYLDEYRKSLLKSTDIAEKYHLNEIESVKNLIANLLRLMWVVGLLSFFATAICIGLNLNVGTIAMPTLGTLLETILGYVMKVLNETLRTKETFFKEDIEMQKYDKVLGLILTVAQEDRKTDLIEKVVDNYLNEENKE